MREERKKNMIFKKKEKKQEPEYLNAQTFVRLFCKLIIPRIRSGKDIETAWEEVLPYFKNFIHERIMFNKAIKYGFSNEVLAAFSQLFYEPTKKGVYSNLLMVFHEYHTASPEELADRLCIYEVENTAIPYDTESYFPKM